MTFPCSHRYAAVTLDDERVNHLLTLVYARSRWLCSRIQRDQAESDTAACNSGPVLIGRSRQRVYAPVAPKILSIAEMDSHTLFSVRRIGR